MAYDRDADHGRDRTVVQTFSSERDAEVAIRALQDAGFGGDDISVLAEDREKAQGVAEDTGADTAKGAGIGAATGGVLGALGGLLLGATALAIPGLGIVVAGPLAAVLGGAGIGAVTGGLSGALAAAGISEGDARRYEERVKAGDILVAVDAGARSDEARRILHQGSYRSSF